MVETRLWGAVCRQPPDGPLGVNLESRGFARLQDAITDLAHAVRDLRADTGNIRDAMRTDYARLIQRQDEMFGVFSDRLEKLVAIQDEQAAASRADYARLIERQDKMFGAFTERLEKLVVMQHEQATVIRSEMRTDFSWLVDRQDSQFRWLGGLIVASGLAVAGLVSKALLR